MTTLQATALQTTSPQMATQPNVPARKRVALERSWHEVVTRQLQALVPAFGLDQAATHIDRAFQLICRESLKLSPRIPAVPPSTLNHDGTPIQFALALSQGIAPLQFLSEIGSPTLSEIERRLLIKSRVRALSELLHLVGDLDSVNTLIQTAAAANIHGMRQDHGGTFWVGASFDPTGNAVIKVYINGKNGTADQQWSRLHDFAQHFGATEKLRELERLAAGKISPLGMAISLSRNDEPSGRIYLSGNGNRLCYYEHLLRHFGGEHCIDAFEQFTEVMFGEDRAYPTQSAVFSIGIGPASNSRADTKMEFCGHCLFQNDVQAHELCLQWLSLRKVDPLPYEKMLAITAGPMSAAKVNSHIYLGLGWKGHQEYSTVYLKPHAHNLNPDN